MVAYSWPAISMRLVELKTGITHFLIFRCALALIAWIVFKAETGYMAAFVVVADVDADPNLALQA